MTKKRIAAIIALCLIGLLYLAALILAFVDTALARSCLMAALFCTIVLPAMAYAYLMILDGTDCIFSLFSSKYGLKKHNFGMLPRFNGEKTLYLRAEIYPIILINNLTIKKSHAKQRIFRKHCCRCYRDFPRIGLPFLSFVLVHLEQA